MSNVIKLANAPNDVLEKAVDVYDTVLIIGWDKDGFLDARASRSLTDQEAVWLAEEFKINLISAEYPLEDDE